MTTIHMDTEITKSLAHQMDQAALRLQEGQNSMRNQVSSLPFIWQGDDAHYFAQEVEQNMRRVQHQIEALHNLNRLLNVEIDQWIQADMDGCGKMGIATPWQPSDWGFAIGSGLGIGAGIGTSGGWMADAYGRISNGIVIGNGSFDAWSELGVGAGFHGKTPDPFDDFSNSISFTNSYVSLMGKMQEKGGLGKARDYNGLFDFVGGLHDGEGFYQAGLSALISTGIGAAVQGSTRFIPGLGTALIVNDAVQFVGSAVAMGLDQAGHHDAAAVLQNNLEAVDFGGYVSDLSDGIADGILDVLNNRPIEPDFSDLGERVGKFGSGLDINMDVSFTARISF